MHLELEDVCRLLSMNPASARRWLAEHGCAPHECVESYGLANALGVDEERLTKPEPLLVSFEEVGKRLGLSEYRVKHLIRQDVLKPASTYPLRFRIWDLLQLENERNRYVTIAEVANLLGLKRATLYRQVVIGAVPSAMLWGLRDYLIPKQWVEDQLRGKEDANASTTNERAGD